jgi:hypothetical protein
MAGKYRCAGARVRERLTAFTAGQPQLQRQQIGAEPAEARREDRARPFARGRLNADPKVLLGGLNWSMQQIHVFTENLVCLEDQEGRGRPPS